MYWKTTLRLTVLLALLTGCQKFTMPQANAESEEEEPVVITKWTKKTELFVEFPPLVVGKESPFAAHLTDLETFQPVSSDVVVTTLTREDGYTLTSRTPAPIIPGIYRPVITPDKAGIYHLNFQRSDPNDESRSDAVYAGEVRVAATQEDLALLEADDEEGHHAHGPTGDHEAHDFQGQGHTSYSGEGGIMFLKEQQWVIDFATEIVSKRTLNAMLNLHAEVEPAVGGSIEIVAPIGGRIIPVKEVTPAPGQKISAGETLAMILPLHSSAKSRDDLQYAVRSAQAELKAGQKELNRIQNLYNDKIVPKRRLEVAKKNVAVIKARLSAVRSRLSLLNVNQETGRTGKFSQSVERFPVQSPISGTITKINLTSGAQIEAGAALFTIIDLDSVWIEGRLFEMDIPKIGPKFGTTRSVEHAHFSAEALAGPITLTSLDSRLVTIGQVIDPVHRSVPLIMQVNNKSGQLRIGMHGHLSVPTGEAVNDVAIPLSAVVDDRGISVAFVHAGGETFERRELALGIENNGYVQVKSGIREGERIVTKMAYRVYLASLSTQLPQHGHAH